MATFIETKVSVTVRIATNEDGSKHAFVTGVSYAADGTRLRELAEVEVTASLNATQQQAALTLLNAAEAYIKNLYGIA